MFGVSAFSETTFSETSVSETIFIGPLPVIYFNSSTLTFPLAINTLNNLDLSINKLQNHELSINKTINFNTRR